MKSLDVASSNPDLAFKPLASLQREPHRSTTLQVISLADASGYLVYLLCTGARTQLFWWLNN